MLSVRAFSAVTCAFAALGTPAPAISQEHSPHGEPRAPSESGTEAERPPGESEPSTRPDPGTSEQQVIDAESSEAEPPAAPVVVPPRALHLPVVRCPQASCAEPLVAEIVVSVDGSVRLERVRGESGAEVTDTVLADAVRASAAELRFEPARRDGVPVAARVLWQVEFAEPDGGAPVAVAAAPVPAPPSTPDAAPGQPAATSEPPPRAEKVVTVRGVSAAEALERSARAVEVVDLADQKAKSADLGEVLARDTAVTVQRAGALGSRSNYGLGGLGGDRLRFFVNGVPLEYLGFFDAAAVPVGFVDRIEVYQGVVPARFGADALAGAVNLVSDAQTRRTGSTLSYQIGSFETQRLAGSTRYYHEPWKAFARATAFYDVAKNDYPVDVEVADDTTGELSPAYLPRFHDSYEAGGGTLSVGIVDRDWADQLSLQVFGAAFDQEVQNNPTMDIPYGEVTFSRITYGGNVRYLQAFSDSTSLDATAGYAGLDTHFLDVATCRYDWYGRCFIEVSAEGEIDGQPLDIALHTDTGFARAELAHRLSDDHLLRFSGAPTYANRTGQNAARVIPDDPLEEPRRLLTAVAGAEWEMSLFDGDLVNIAFGKGYALASQSQELLGTGAMEDTSTTLATGGGGDSLRVALGDHFQVKGSYEFATRLPNTDELFGDGMFVVSNTTLRPEQSHNMNLEFALLGTNSEWSPRASVLGFARYADDLIVLLSDDDYLRYDNVLDARALGVEASAGLANQADWFELDGRVGYQDLRNRSLSGAYVDSVNERIPNLPYLTGSLSLRLRAHDTLTDSDEIELSWDLRYVHGFLRGWENIGSASLDRLEIPTQVTQGLGLSYLLELEHLTLTNSVEVQNLFNEQVYDFYGLQRPGRSFFAKLTFEHRKDP